MYFHFTHTLRYIAVIFVGGLIVSCSTSKPHYRYQSTKPSGSYTLSNKDSIKHTVYLLGDGGNTHLEEHAPNFELLGRMLSKEGENATLVLLGDNIYPAGLPAEGAENRKEAEGAMNAQLDLAKKFDGELYAIPGNHDWNHWSAGGREAILRQAEYAKEYLGKKNVVYPKDGCGDPKAIKLEEDLTLILLDSQWFLHPWEEEPDMNKGCKVKSRDEFKAVLEEIIDENDDGDFIFAFHHPLFSDGPHGGWFTLRDHIFPLTRFNKGLYIPLPVLGSVGTALRHAGISNQEVKHPQYMHLKEILREVTYDAGHVVFASGHEHTLQYFTDPRSFAITGIVKADRHYIVSGSGSEETYIVKNGQSEFGYAGYGFARLQYYKNGEVWMEFWRPSETSADGELLFRKRIKSESLQISDKVDNADFDHPAKVKAVADSSYVAEKGQRTWLGDLHREAWLAEIEFPTLDLSNTKYGNLTPIKKGGGIQTKSLRLENENGKQYTMRSVDKDVTLLIPEFARGTVVQDFAQDELAMAHPYGAWVVPELANAAGVYHTNPDFYYVPKQDALGDFKEYFGDGVYLLEERPAKNRDDVASFGYAKDVESTRKVLRKIRDTYEHKVKQEEVLRARLLDIWLGDWDRHDDQWRWAKEEEGDFTTYRPIPRDRDQVFLKVDGIIPWFVSRKWGARMFQDFDYDIRDIQGLCFNARFFDRTFLTEMDEEDWINMAEEMKPRLTDEVMKSAFEAWPKELYDINGDIIIDKLKSRRAKLTDFAKEYYSYLAKEVDVWGTDKRERFIVERLNDQQTKVTVYAVNKKGEEKAKMYERVFKKDETKEIRLYGFQGKDEFILTGNTQKGIKVRIIGGQGNDKVETKISNGKAGKVLVYDTSEGNEVAWNAGFKNKTTIGNEANVYERKAFTLDSYLPLIVPGWNVDDGFVLGAGILKTNHGFRKEPYKSKHSFMAKYAFATQALQGSYSWDQVGVFGKWDFLLNAEAFAPTHVRNYFGLGNNTVYTDENDDDFDFNRLRQSRIVINPSFKKFFSANRHTFRIGPVYDYNLIDRTVGRFIAQEAERTAGDFDPKHYVGVEADLQINAVDNNFLPRRGFKWNVNTSWKTNLSDNNNSFTRLSTDLSLYHFTKRPVPIVWATRVGFANNWGNYDFFQANTLGRRTNLRGFRGERFAGDAAFFHNTDLRIGLANTKSYWLPMEIGLVGFFDHGRVWLEGEDSDEWHMGYGGGLLLSPYQTLVTTLTYSISDEFNIFEFRLGFYF
ncbi:MAG: BamA/TamA family outer membrane protein [Bacteroidota bacterium]